MQFPNGSERMYFRSKGDSKDKNLNIGLNSCFQMWQTALKDVKAKIPDSRTGVTSRESSIPVDITRKHFKPSVSEQILCFSPISFAEFM
jgi:hypothetical protein